MREENLALLRRAFDAFARGDLETIRRMSAEDCIWHTTGHPPFEPEYKGFAGVTAYLTSLVELTDGTFRTELESLLAEEDHVVAIEHVTASRKGRLLDTHVVHVFYVRDGKVFRTVEYAAEPRKLEEFWS